MSLYCVWHSGGVECGQNACISVCVLVHMSGVNRDATAVLLFWWCLCVVCRKEEQEKCEIRF